MVAIYYNHFSHVAAGTEICVSRGPTYITTPQTSKKIHQVSFIMIIYIKQWSQLKLIYWLESHSHGQKHQTSFGLWRNSELCIAGQFEWGRSGRGVHLMIYGTWVHILILCQPETWLISKKWNMSCLYINTMSAFLYWYRWKDPHFPFFC
jgi:hypothetical protein